MLTHAFVVSLSMDEIPSNVICASITAPYCSTIVGAFVPVGSVGASLGPPLGTSEGTSEGCELGLIDGSIDGPIDGTLDARTLGILEGFSLGDIVTPEGPIDGSALGGSTNIVGDDDGVSEGDEVSCELGAVGALVAPIGDDEGDDVAGVVDVGIVVGESVVAVVGAAVPHPQRAGTAFWAPTQLACGI